MRALLLFALWGALGCLKINAQQPRVFFVKKDALLMFFQKGKSCDTLIEHVNDLFFLVIPDSLKSSVYLSIENGQLNPAKSDSLVRLSYLPGLRYDYIYFPEQTYTDTDAGKTKNSKLSPKGSYRTLIAGTSASPAGQVTVKLLNSRQNKLLYEKTWVYKPQP